MQSRSHVVGTAINAVANSMAADTLCTTGLGTENCPHHKLASHGFQFSICRAMPVTMPASPDMHGQPAQSRRLDHALHCLSLDTLIHKVVRSGEVSVLEIFRRPFMLSNVISVAFTNAAKEEDEESFFVLCSKYNNQTNQ